MWHATNSHAGLPAKCTIWEINVSWHTIWEINVSSWHAINTPPYSHQHSPNGEHRKYFMIFYRWFKPRFWTDDDVWRMSHNQVYKWCIVATRIDNWVLKQLANIDLFTLFMGGKEINFWSSVWGLILPPHYLPIFYYIQILRFIHIQ